MNDDNLHKPIFFDPTQRRYSVLSAFAAILSFLAIMGALIFKISSAATPKLSDAAMASRPTGGRQIHPAGRAIGVKPHTENPIEQTVRQKERIDLKHARDDQDAKQ